VTSEDRIKLLFEMQTEQVKLGKATFEELIASMIALKKASDDGSISEVEFAEKFSKLANEAARASKEVDRLEKATAAAGLQAKAQADAYEVLGGDYELVETHSVNYAGALRKEAEESKRVHSATINTGRAFRDAAAAKDQFARRPGSGARSFAYIIDDLQYVDTMGIRPILNNLMMISPSLFFVGLGVDQLSRHWSQIFGDMDKDVGPAKSSVESLKDEIEKLNKKEVMFTVDTTQLENAKKQLADIEKREATIKSLQESKSKAQQDQAKEVRELITGEENGEQKLERAVKDSLTAEGKIGDAAFAKHPIFQEPKTRLEGLEAVGNRKMTPAQAAAIAAGLARRRLNPAHFGEDSEKAREAVIREVMPGVATMSDQDIDALHGSIAMKTADPRNLHKTDNEVRAEAIEEMKMNLRENLAKARDELRNNAVHGTIADALESPAGLANLQGLLDKHPQAFKNAGLSEEFQARLIVQGQAKPGDKAIIERQKEDFKEKEKLKREAEEKQKIANQWIDIAAKEYADQAETYKKGERDKDSAQLKANEDARRIEDQNKRKAEREKLKADHQKLLDDQKREGQLNRQVGGLGEGIVDRAELDLAQEYTPDQVAEFYGRMTGNMDLGRKIAEKAQADLMKRLMNLAAQNIEGVDAQSAVIKSLMNRIGQLEGGAARMRENIGENIRANRMMFNNRAGK
jgi:hypothetical protein